MANITYKLRWTNTSFSATNILFFNLNYIELFMLLKLSQFIPCAPLHSLKQFPHCCPCPWVVYILFCSLANPFTFFQPAPSSSHPSYSCPSIPCFYASDSIMPLSLFFPLDSTYTWDHVGEAIETANRNTILVFSRTKLWAPEAPPTCPLGALLCQVQGNNLGQTQTQTWVGNLTHHLPWSLNGTFPSQ